MDRTSLFAWEFYAFLALAAWLFYRQFLGPWLKRGSQGSDASTQERRAETEESPDRGPES